MFDCNSHLQIWAFWTPSPHKTWSSLILQGWDSWTNINGYWVLWSEIVKESGVGCLLWHYEYTTSPKSPPCFGLHKAFIFCFEASFWKVEIDCKDPSLFQALTDDCLNWSEIGLMVEDVKHAQVIEGPLIWLELSPPCLQNILYKIEFYFNII